MKSFKLIILMLLAALFASCDVTAGLEDVNLDYLVIEGYLYSDRNITDIRLTAPVPMEEDTTGLPVTDASVRLIKNERVYELVPRDNNGYYHYPGDDLTIKEGDHFRIEADYFGKTAFAETLVPFAPENVVVTVDTFYVSRPGDMWPPGEMPSPEGPGSATIPEVQWLNPDGLPFFVFMENIEDEPESIYGSLQAPMLPLQIRSVPTTADSAFLGQIYFLGSYRVTVYRINPEYEELYTYQEQDSRFLNEPPSNVTNGVGIFTAFSGVSETFYVETN